MNRGIAEIAAAWVIAIALIASLAAHVFTPDKHSTSARVVAPAAAINLRHDDAGLPLVETPFAPRVDDDAGAVGDLASTQRPAATTP